MRTGDIIIILLTLAVFALAIAALMGFHWVVILPF
jgi:hypothetical protein